MSVEQRLAQMRRELDALQTDLRDIAALSTRIRAEIKRGGK